MKHRRWACWARVEGLLRVGLAAALLLCAAAAATAQIVNVERVSVLLDDSSAIPADADARWAAASLPDSQDTNVAWYRVEFSLVAHEAENFWMLYLPYFYGGGRIWINGEPMAAVLENSATLHVRWERPLLLPMPLSALRSGHNVLHLRVVSAHQPSGIKLPQLVVGAQRELQTQFDRRLFLVRTVPLVTVLSGAAVGIGVIFIWLRRRQEVQYGLFGVAALLWALRTTTFIFDALPASVWPLWRMLYHASTGGFIIVLALFVLSQAGWFRPRLAWALAAYGVLGPALYLLAGDSAEEIVGRWWVLGLVPVGLSVALVSFITAWRQPGVGTVLIALAVLLAAAAGVHDYLVAWSSPTLEALLPRWSGHRIFLLHHAANVLLVVMGALLTVRFVRSLHEVEEANRTLEARVAESEREIAATYARIAALQSEQATLDERQRIMQDLHDGLGSQLFTSLLRAERGALDGAATVQTLRGAIDEMRVAIEALASDERDFRTAFGNFRFRWDPRLREAGLQPVWLVELPDKALALAPHDALQLLRVAQEALTNVVKHARAGRVVVSLRQLGAQLGTRLELVVSDNGHGPATAGGGGRGLANMRTRAARLGARLDIGPAEPGEPGMHGAPGMRVCLSMPLASD